MFHVVGVAFFLIAQPSNSHVNIYQTLSNIGGYLTLTKDAVRVHYRTQMAINETGGTSSLIKWEWVDTFFHSKWLGETILDNVLLQKLEELSEDWLELIGFGIVWNSFLLSE